MTESQTIAPETGTATATPSPKFDTTDVAGEMAAFLAEIGEAKPSDAAPVEAAESVEAPGDEAPANDAPADEAKADEKPAEGEESLSRQLNAIRRARQREEAVIAKQRAALEAKAAEVQQLAARHGEVESQIKAWNAAKAQARRDPASVLLSLGYKPAELAEAAKLVFYASPDATESMRQEAQQYQRTREVDETTAQLAAKVNALEEQLAQREQAAMQERTVKAFIASVDEAAAAAPLVARLAKVDRDEFMVEIERAAISIHRATKQAPTPQAVVEAVEARLKRIAGLGNDSSKTTNQHSRETKPARTLGNDLSTTTRPRPASSTPDEDLAAFLADVEAGRVG